MTAVFTSRVDWSKWAEHAPERQCRACDAPFKPNHPRRRYCGGEGCPGRRPTARPRRRRPSGRAQENARRRGIQGFLGDVVILMQRPAAPAGDGAAVIDAAKEWARAEKAGDPQAARDAVTRLAAAAAARALTLVPPHPATDETDEDDHDLEHDLLGEDDHAAA